MLRRSHHSSDIYQQLTSFQRKTIQGSNQDMGPQQEHPSGRDGTHNKDSAETWAGKQTDCLSSPKTARQLRENKAVHERPSCAGVWREQGREYGREHGLCRYYFRYVNAYFGLMI